MSVRPSVGLTQRSMTQWLAANTSLRFGQISRKFGCCLMVRHLLNRDFL